jgi:5-methylcytosine-specific restriction endonuclease McrA
MILARDGNMCMIRGPRCTGVATQVDHVVSWRELPEEQWFVPELLRGACRSCNSQAGARRQAELAELGRQSVRDPGRRNW